MNQPHNEENYKPMFPVGSAPEYRRSVRSVVIGLLSLFCIGATFLFNEYRLLTLICALAVLLGMWAALGRTPWPIRYICSWLSMLILFVSQIDQNPSQYQYQYQDTYHHHQQQQQQHQIVEYNLDYFSLNLGAIIASMMILNRKQRLVALYAEIPDIKTSAAQAGQFSISGLLQLTAKFCVAVVLGNHAVQRFLQFDYWSRNPGIFLGISLGGEFLIGAMHAFAGLYGMLEERIRWKFLLFILLCDGVLLYLQYLVRSLLGLSNFVEHTLAYVPLMLANFLIVCVICRLFRTFGYRWIKTDSAQSVV